MKGCQFRLAFSNEAWHQARHFDSRLPLWYTYVIVHGRLPAPYYGPPMPLYWPLTGHPKTHTTNALLTATNALLLAIARPPPPCIGYYNYYSASLPTGHQGQWSPVGQPHAEGVTSVLIQVQPPPPPLKIIIIANYNDDNNNNTCNNNNNTKEATKVIMSTVSLR